MLYKLNLETRLSLQLKPRNEESLQESIVGMLSDLIHFKEELYTHFWIFSPILPVIQLCPLFIYLFIIFIQNQNRLCALSPSLFLSLSITGPKCLSERIQLHPITDSDWTLCVSLHFVVHIGTLHLCFTERSWIFVLFIIFLSGIIQHCKFYIHICLCLQGAQNLRSISHIHNPGLVQTGAN